MSSGRTIGTARCHNRNSSNTIVRHLFSSINKSAVQNSEFADKLSGTLSPRLNNFALNSIGASTDLQAINLIQQTMSLSEAKELKKHLSRWDHKFALFLPQRLDFDGHTFVSFCILSFNDFFILLGRLVTNY
ncbi:hypothetical protein IC582_017172 [Cucumis melo]